jgi:thiamine pyrophosphokinase
MGLFGRKKVKTEVCIISGDQLFQLLKKAVKLASEDIDSHCYTIGPEIIFEYNGKVHLAGVKYDKKRAKVEKRVTFSRDLVNLYVDKDIYQTIEDVYDNATVDKIPLKAIEEGIIVSPEYKELL